MALRPIPNLSDAAAMARNGRLHALKDARRDALNNLRDIATQMQSGSHGMPALITKARAVLDRLDEIEALESKEYTA